MGSKKIKAAKRAEREAKGIRKHTGRMRIFANERESEERARAHRDADELAKVARPVRIKLWCPKCHHKIEHAIKHPTRPGVLLARCGGCKHDWKLTPQGAHADESARVQRTTVEEVASEVMGREPAPAEPTIEEIAEANGTTPEEITKAIKSAPGQFEASPEAIEAANRGPDYLAPVDDATDRAGAMREVMEGEPPTLHEVAAEAFEKAKASPVPDTIEVRARVAPRLGRRKCYACGKTRITYDAAKVITTGKPRTNDAALIASGAYDPIVRATCSECLPADVLRGFEA